jgi:hypothetical protein
MKRETFTPFFFLLVLLSACSKSDIPARPVMEVVAPIAQLAPDHSTAVVTGWESAGTWSRSAGPDGTITFSTSQALPGLSPDILENGLVLVYASGYNLAAPALDKPLSLPLYFYTSAARADKPFYWQFAARQGAVNVSVTVQADEEQRFTSSRSGIRLRYVVVPPSMLQTLQLAREELHNLSYREVTALLQAAP